MPQMSPILWTLLFMLFSLLLMTITTKIYFSYYSHPSPHSTKPKLMYFNLSW